MQPRLGDLINAIRAALPAIPALRKGRGLRTVWHRPPLAVADGRALGGIKLDEFARPTLTLSGSEFRGIFEEYAEAYLGNAGAVSTIPTWMANRLKLNPRLADWYFPEGIEVSPHVHHLAVLLWLASFAKDVTEANLADSTFLIKLENTEFGVVDGVLVSKFTSYEFGSVDFNAILESHEKVGRQRRSYDDALSAFWVATHAIEEDFKRETTQLALRFVFYKFSHMGRLTDYLYKGYERRVRGVSRIKAVCVELLDYLTSVPNPGPEMYRRLVGSGLMEESEFNRTFHGSTAYEPSHPISVDTITTWHKALQQLSKGK